MSVIRDLLGKIHAAVGWQEAEDMKIAALAELAALEKDRARLEMLRKKLSKAWYELSLDTTLGEVLKLIDGKPNAIDLNIDAAMTDPTEAR
jgi:general stress protein 26